MAQQGKDLAVVHLEIDPVDGTELVRVYLSKILDFQILVLELKSGDFGRNRLVVLLVEILQLKGIDDLLVSTFILLSVPALNLLFSELIVVLLILLTPTAHGEAETTAESLAVGSRQDPIEVETEQREDDRRYEQHHQTCYERVVIYRLCRIAKSQAHLTAFQIAKNSTHLLHGDLRDQ